MRVLRNDHRWARRATLGAASIALLASGCLAWHPPTVTPVDGATGNLMPARLFGGDFDGDGLGDLVGYTYGAGGPKAFVLWSEGDGTFTQEDLAPGRRPTAVGDFDGDGVDDVVLGGVVPGETISRALFFGGPADGTRPRGLTDADSLALPSSAGLIDGIYDDDGVGDYNGDGHLDWLRMTYENLYYERYTPMLNDGTGTTFTAAPSRSVLSGPINAGLNGYTQVNLDGLDQLFAHGIFDQTPWRSAGIEPLAWGDIDGDGNDDFAAVVSGELLFYRLTPWSMDPFVDYQDIAVSGTPFVRLLDLDGDDITDLAYSDAAGSNYLSGTADGGFPYEQAGTGPTGPADFVDVDGDGLLDAVTVSADGGSVEVHINRSTPIE